MKAANVEQIIKELFRQNYNAYQSSYPMNADGTATDEASMNVADVAKGYYANRTEDEIERDERLRINEIDYVEWCMAEFSNLIQEESNRNF